MAKMTIKRVGAKKRSPRNKFGVAPKTQRTLKGKVYDSKLEMNYRIHLDKLRKAVSTKFRVVDIKEQLPFECVVNGKKVCTYICDFAVQYADGRIEYVDTKGIITTEFRLKKKLVEALFPVTIKVVKRGDF